MNISKEMPWCVVFKHKSGINYVIADGFKTKEGAAYFAAGIAAKNGNGEYIDVVNMYK